MLTRVLFGIGLGLLGTYGYLEFTERSRDRVASVSLEPFLGPSGAGTVADAGTIPTVSAGDAATVEVDDPGSGQASELASLTTVMPEQLPETMAAFAAQPAINLLTGSTVTASANSVTPLDAMFANGPTGSISPPEDQLTRSLEADDEANVLQDTLDDAKTDQLTSALSAEDPPESSAAEAASRAQSDRTELPLATRTSAAPDTTADAISVRMMTVDVGMVALRAEPSQTSLISGTAQRGDMLTAIPIEGSNWMLVQDARSGAFGYLPRTVLKDILN